MYVSVRDKQTLDLALNKSGLKPRREVKFVGRTRTGQEKYSLTLSPSSPLKYVRYSTSGRRLGNVACSHGYCAFVENLFELDPEASIKSSATRKKGIGKVTKGNLDFARKDIAEMNIGSQMIPLEYSKACNCEADLPAKDYRMMLGEQSRDFSGAIRRAQGYVLRSDEAEKLR